MVHWGGGVFAVVRNIGNLGIIALSDAVIVIPNVRAAFSLCGRICFAHALNLTVMKNLGICLWLPFVVASSHLCAQLPDAKRDYQWIIGYADTIPEFKTVINLFDFNHKPFKIEPFGTPSMPAPNRAYK